MRLSFKSLALIADECVTATLHFMLNGWTPEQLLDAVRSAVSSVEACDERVPATVLLDGQDLLLTFSWPDQPHLFGIRFRPSESPEGPSTGEVCESPEEWAQEVTWVLMEELGTGLVHRGRRTVTTQGIVELHYRPDC
ncbi:hypothetical protein Pve01_94010 [Planomonospora venezuelensis]|nr:hypothetical protein Pve01_94010 [Planomonospora venezuelensis]